MLAHTQISTELNTTTDNPLIDAKGKQFHHGGNFQAMSISVAVESVRSAVQLIGRLSFAQLTELLNCKQTHLLLIAKAHSPVRRNESWSSLLLSWQRAIYQLRACCALPMDSSSDLLLQHCKGLDIASAAYAAELGFLSGSQAAHFQSAEMHVSHPLLSSRVIADIFTRTKLSTAWHWPLPVAPSKQTRS